MEVRAVAKYIGVCPLKARLVIDMVRGKGAQDALAMLKFVTKGAADPVSKLIRSAVANAEENYGVAADELYIAEITADGGPLLKRRRFGARGRFKPMVRRTAHLSVTLASRS